jgi:L-threonylcarbamoyladenylate synthase
MTLITKQLSTEIGEIITQGGVGVLPTDTLYGLVGSAHNPASVERIYALRQRKLDKPMIILISGWLDLELFDIRLDAEIKRKLETFWPGSVSVILPCSSEKFAYLHRGKKSLAFRWPDKKDLLELLKKTGPLVAPSANIEGLVPAKTIVEARQYFGDRVDFYVDQDERDCPPSTLVVIKDGKAIVKRKGILDTKLL